MEEVRDIPNHPGYGADCKGVVYTKRYLAWTPGKRGCQSVIGDTWRVLNPWVGADGYLRVTFIKKQRRPVHQLVLEAFAGPCPAGMEARHLDGNHLNNCADNLAWGTRSENALDRVRHGTQPRSHYKLTEAKVQEIRRLYATGEWTQQQLAEKFGIAQAVVSSIVLRKIWRSVA